MASILSDPLTTACIFILLLEMIFGMSSTLFVIGVIVKESKQGKTIKTANKIRIVLYMSNVCYSITVFAGAISGFLGPKKEHIINSPLAYVVYSLDMFTMTSSSWLTAALSLFYFIKIVDFKTKAMVWAKENIKAVVPWMILGAEVLSLCSSVLGVLLFFKPHVSSMNNSTLSSNNSVSNYATGFLSIALTLSCPPFLIIVVTFSCIAIILNKHHHNMMENMGTSTNNKKISYGNLVPKIMRGYITYSVYYLLVFLYYVVALLFLRAELWILLLILSSFTPLLSIQIIITTPKLKKTAEEMLNFSLC